MTTPRLVVVGASLAGLRAVETARRSGFNGPVTLIGAESRPPYDRPPLSKEFLTKAAAAKFFYSEAELRDDLDIDLRLGTTATALDTEEQVIIAGGEEVPYTGLVIATGAAPRMLPGMTGLAGIHTLRTLDDALEIRAALRPGARIVIVGAGFIGAEVASAARRRGATVTMVEAATVPLVRALGEEMGAACMKLHQRSGIDVRCGVTVESITGAGHVDSVYLSDGTMLGADIVLVGIGAVPATGWMDGSGLSLDDGVLCDETLNAGVPGVYAAGDVARWFNPLFAQTMRQENWTNAAEQGRLAALNALDSSRAAPCTSVPYFWSDWDGNRIQFVGVPACDDIEVVSGSPEEGRFLALYRRGEQIIGALGVNQPQVARLRILIAQRTNWPEALAYAQGHNAA